MVRFQSERIWTSEIEVVTGCRQKELVHALLRIRKLHWEIGDSEYQNTFKKFSDEKFHCVALMTPLPLTEVRFDRQQF